MANLYASNCKDLSLLKTYLVCFLSVKKISSEVRIFMRQASKPPAGGRISSDLYFLLVGSMLPQHMALSVRSSITYVCVSKKI